MTDTTERQAARTGENVAMAGETVHSNSHAAAGAPVLNILTPVFRNDPSALIRALARDSAGLAVDLTIVDDGSGDPALTAAMRAEVDGFPAPARLITLHANAGRSGARNRLMAEATAPYLLFLDSDMLPDSPGFVRAWLDMIERVRPAIAYGGFSTRHAPDVPEHALARALAEQGDCRPASDRIGRGPLAVATSNLLVRADVMRAVPFDGGFQGWGWEDVEWALRASEEGYAISHVDIPATHLGLDTAPVLLEKYARSGPNFGRITARHPRMLTLPGTRAARLLAKAPGQSVLRPLLRALAMSDGAPMSWRTRAARLWRASWAAQALAGR